MDRRMPGMITHGLQEEAGSLSGWSCHDALRALRTLTRDVQVLLGLDNNLRASQAANALSRYDEDRPNALTVDELAARAPVPISSEPAH